MKRAWVYFTNQFDNVTRHSSGKMLRIATDHDSRLHAERSDPDIDVLWKDFHPLLLVFRAAISARNSATSTKMSKTLVLTKLLKQLSDSWIRVWEGKVFFYFPDGSPEALSIFPNRRIPFQSENYEERILAINTLAERMSVYEELNDVVIEVRDKYQLLFDARDAQRQALKVVEKRTDLLEEHRWALARALYRNMGALMIKYDADPIEGQRFFNESLFRRSGSDANAVYNHSAQVNAALSQVIALPKKFNIDINAQLSIQNSAGGSVLHFFFANSASISDSSLKAMVMPGETLEIGAGEIGWSSASNILIVKNVGHLTAEYELTLTGAAE